MDACSDNAAGNTLQRDPGVFIGLGLDVDADHAAAIGFLGREAVSKEWQLKKRSTGTMKGLLGVEGDVAIAHTYPEEPRPTLCNHLLTWRRDHVIADKQAVCSIIGHESKSVHAIAHWRIAEGRVTCRTLSLREDVRQKAFDGHGTEEGDVGKNRQREKKEWDHVEDSISCRGQKGWVSQKLFNVRSG